MPTEFLRRKQFLFVDDDPNFLAGIGQVFADMSKGSWEILTAENHSQALALLRKKSVDVVVLDLAMPVMDGLQFLQLLSKTHPGQQVAILTGQTSEKTRKSCLESGAALFLEKVITPQGFAAVFDALDMLASAAAQEGFHGMMRRVGLPEVLQMECLGRKSSVLEVFTRKARGKIFIYEGDIIHAESGSLQGEMALYGLLGLRGGEFNLRPFAEPAVRTISGQYEFLLMEAARLNDEGTNPLESAPAAGVAPEVAISDVPRATLKPQESPAPAVKIEEILLCSGSGELLYESQPDRAKQRLDLLKEIETTADRISKLLPSGRFERAEFAADQDRIICRLEPEMRLLVRST